MYSRQANLKKKKKEFGSIKILSLCNKKLLYKQIHWGFKKLLLVSATSTSIIKANNKE